MTGVPEEVLSMLVSKCTIHTYVLIMYGMIWGDERIQNRILWFFDDVFAAIIILRTEEK